MLQVVQQPALRGAEVFARQLSSALAARGHETRTAYLYASTDQRFAIDPVDVVIGGSPRHPMERVLVQPSVVAGLMGVLKAFKPHVVQLNGGRALKYGAVLRHLHRREAWVTIYRNIGDPEFWIRGSVKRLAYRLGVFSGVDGVVALSRASERVLAERFGVEGPMEVIPTGLSPEHQVPSESRSAVRKRMGTGETDPVVLYVGNLAAEKRVDRLIAGFSTALGAVPGSRLWLVGEGPERQALERLTKQLSLRERTSFVGQTGDVASFYAAADVFALTSDSEGIPGVLLEAAYAQLPIVVTDVGLVRECTLDGQSALLVRPSVDAVAVALVRLLQDDELRRRLGERGRLLVEERFLISDIAQRYEAFYRRVLASRHSTS